MMKIHVEKIGKELRLRRVNMGYTMAQMAEKVGVSENFISEIELDKKVPADEKYVYSLAKAYNIESAYLFRRFNKVPSEVIGEFAENKALADTLFAISKDNRLSDTKKEILYEQFRRLYSETLDE